MRRRPNAALFAFLCLISLAPPARALRVAGELGFGSTQSSKDSSYSEGPFLQSYAIDSDLDTRNVLGVEHIRSLSLSPMSTAISFTGIVYHYYLNSTPGPFNDVTAMKNNTIEYRDWAAFVGASLGLAQSSSPPDANDLQTAAAGVYLSPKAGVDYPMSGNWGMRGELVFTMLVFGSGSINSMGLGGGFYLSF